MAQVDPEKRLGSGPAGVADIKAHEWFTNLNWRSVENRTLSAPLQPDPEFQPEDSVFEPFQAEVPKNSQGRKDVFAEEWEELWDWVGSRDADSQP